MSRHELPAQMSAIQVPFVCTDQHYACDEPTPIARSKEAFAARSNL